MKMTAQVKTEKVEGGLKVQSGTHGFTVVCDEPIASGGTDAGMNPVELELSSLGSCITIAAFILAQQKGINVEHFAVELEGDIDPEGFMGISPDVRNGFSEIRIVPHIKCDASEEDARAYVEFVESRCPVRDNLINGVPIVVSDIVVE